MREAEVPDVRHQEEISYRRLRVRKDSLLCEANQARQVLLRQIHGLIRPHRKAEALLPPSLLHDQVVVPQTHIATVHHVQAAILPVHTAAGRLVRVVAADRIPVVAEVAQAAVAAAEDNFDLSISFFDKILRCVFVIYKNKLFL